MKKQRVMKRAVSFVLGFAIVLGFLGNDLQADHPVDVTIDGVAVNFPGGQGPVIEDGRTLVPIRGVFEMLGFHVDWDNATRTAILINMEYEIRITVGSDVFTVNNIQHILDVPAQLINGRTMVPIRLPLESVGFCVDWNDYARTVEIITNTEQREWADLPETNQSRMGQWSQITVIGDERFTRNTQMAIDLIRTSAPDMYDEVLYYLGIIRQYSFSGMWYWMDPPEFRVGTESYTASLAWYASIIIHDAVHSRQAYENPLTFQDINSQLWHDAEMEALDYQIEFFRILGADPLRYVDNYIRHIENLRSNPWWLEQITW